MTNPNFVLVRSPHAMSLSVSWNGHCRHALSGVRSPSRNYATSTRPSKLVQRRISVQRNLSSSLGATTAAPLAVMSLDYAWRICPFERETLAWQTSNSSSATILASSSVVSSNKLSLWSRCKKWLQYWFRAMWKALAVASRSTEIGFRLSPLVIMAPLAWATSSTRLTEWTWSYTISAMQALGPVAVKFCQWVATRRDIFPPMLCDRLAQLHDRGFPHSMDYTEQVLEETYGDYRSRGLVLEEVVGCGSAAQVYRGHLTSKDTNGHETTRAVAVKVLHPNFSESVERDLFLMQSLADLLHALPSDTIRLVNLPRVTQNFGKTLRLQADLNNEANNLQQFHSNFDKSGVFFPQPVAGWSSERVLIEDFVHEATPIATYLNDSSPTGIKLRRELAGPLIRAFLKMVFIDNFVHCDLHPGNVMIRVDVVPKSPYSTLSLLTNLASFLGFQTNNQFTQNFNGKEENEVRRTIVFLDAGIANSLSRDDQRNLVDLFRAVIFNDGARAGRLMVERAKHETCSQVQGGVDAFANGVAEIVSEFHDRRKEGLTLGAVRIGSLLSRVLDLCRIHGVEIDPAMASVVLSTLVLEGLSRSLSPELNLLDFAKPFLIARGGV